MSLTNVVDQFFAARVGTGAISTWSYANRILALLVGLSATAVSRATLPVFSQAEAHGSTRVARMARHWAGLLVAIGAAAVLIGWLMAPWAVAILFERGAFTAADTLAVTEVLRYGLLQLPLFLPSLVLVSVVSSRQHYGVLFVSGVLGLVSKLIGNAALVPLAGLNGLMLSNAFVYGVTGAFLVLMIKPVSRQDVQ
jgi:peptidoglycan biosynthesis protein MviN/MurJ (putative lipid II flippase)